MIGTLMAVAYMRSEEMRDVLKIWPRWMYTAVGVWIALALLLTKTRGSLAGCLVGLIVLAALHTRASTKFDIGALATLFITFVTVGFGSAIISYLERGQDISKLSTLNERTNLWAQAFQEFKVRPIFGDGLGASRGIFLDTIGLGGGHNAFVNVLVDAGLLGTLPFLALLTMVGFALYRFRRGTDGFRDAVLLLPIFCGLIVNSMTAEFMAVPANNASIWLFLFVGWIAVLRRTETPAYTPRVMTR